MLKTCFSSRKGYHLHDEDLDYDCNKKTAESTIGFEQFQWSNELNKLLPSNLRSHDEDENGDGESGAEAKVKEKRKLSKDERKELRKLKRERRKLPKGHRRMALRSSSSAGSQSLKESISLVESSLSIPESFVLHNTTLYKEDLMTLKDQEWLNDNIITYAYNILEQYQLKPFYKRFNLNENSILLLPPSLCYLVLIAKDPLELVSMFPENFSKCKFLILPLNDGGSHWSLSVISILDKSFYAYDSIVNLNDVESGQICVNFNKIIGKLLNKPEFRLVKRDLPTPQQLNDFDCGIFVICLTCFIVSELIGSRLEGSKSWRLDFNLNAKVSSVDSTLLRRFILQTVLDVMIKDPTPNI